MGASTDLCGADLGAFATGAPAAGPAAGGGLSGPVDCAARVVAQKNQASGSFERKCLRVSNVLGKRVSPDFGDK